MQSAWNKENLVKLATMASVLVLAFPDLALAVAPPSGTARNLGDSVDQVLSGMEWMPVVLAGAAYLAGGSLILAGAGLLKKHADQPNGTPLAAGLTRIFGGAFIAVLPMALKWGIKTFAFNGGTTTMPYVPFNEMGSKFNIPGA